MSPDDDTAPDEHKRKLADTFSRAAPGYDAVPFFHAFGARLVALADIRPGARVLDVACGRGAVLFPAADAVGPQGEVVGIDLAEGMVNATAAECERRGLSQISIRCMDAEELDFPDGHFDRVLCGFGVFFFPRALAEFRRVLAPGGRLGLSTWGEDDHRWDWLDDLIRRYLPPEPEPPKADTDNPQPDFRKPEGLRAFLGQAGFVDIQVVTDAAERFYTSPAEWWGELWTHGARIVLEAIMDNRGQTGLEQFKAEAFAKMAAMRQSDGYPERQIAHFTIASRQ
jgi:ubiquinone/menaquinone biosynthesis C-methylase UbiE